MEIHAEQNCEEQVQNKTATSKEITAENGFYTLIPRGSGFEKVHEPEIYSVKRSENVVTECDKWKLRLLSSFGYVNNHETDLRTALYLKSQFILRNACPKLHKAAKEGLKILVSDTGLLFGEYPPILRHEKINSQFLSNMRRMYRDRNSEESIDNFIETLYIPHNKETVERLKLVITEIKRSRRSAREWLYSKKHVKDKVDALEAQNGEVTIVDNRSSALNTENLDLKKCASTLNEIFSAEISEEECEHFIDYCLIPYIKHQEKVWNGVEDSKIVFDHEAVSQQLSELEKRYKRLSLLEKSFTPPTRSTVYKSPITKQQLDEIDWWGFQKESDADLKEPERKQLTALEKAIRNFFIHIKRPLNGKPSANFLGQRVCWLFKYLEDKKVSNQLKPWYYFAMIFSCGRSISRFDEIQASVNISLRNIFTNVGKARIRCAEIQFLQDVQNIYQLTDSDRIENWNAYILLRGDSVYSLNELAIWELVGASTKGFEQFSSISYPAYFWKCCREGITIHLECLSYQSTSKAHLGGYAQYFKDNKQEISELALKVDDRNKQVRAYIKQWSSPKATNKQRLVALEAICAETEFKAVPVLMNCPDEEYKCLVMETAIQLCEIRKARRKIMTWFRHVYQLPEHRLLMYDD